MIVTSNQLRVLLALARDNQDEVQVSHVSGRPATLRVEMPGGCLKYMKPNGLLVGRLT